MNPDPEITEWLTSCENCYFINPSLFGVTRAWEEIDRQLAQGKILAINSHWVTNTVLSEWWTGAIEERLVLLNKHYIDWTKALATHPDYWSSKFQDKVFHVDDVGKYEAHYWYGSCKVIINGFYNNNTVYKYFVSIQTLRALTGR